MSCAAGARAVGAYAKCTFTPWAPLVVAGQPVTAREINLELTLRSGQTFRWVPSVECVPLAATKQPKGGASKQAKTLSRGAYCRCWSGFIDQHFTQLGFIDGSTLHWRQLNPRAITAKRRAVASNECAAVVKYLSLDLNLTALTREWTRGRAGEATPRKEPLTPANPLRQSLHELLSHADDIGGLRLLRQAPHETLFSFLCSQNNNIKRISTMIDTLCSELGTPVASVYVPVGDPLAPRKSASGAAPGKSAGVEGEGESVIPGHGALVKKTLCAFPTLGQLAAAPEERLRALGFGYRAAYVHMSAQQILAQQERSGGTETSFYDALQKMSETDCRATLLELRGVGRKVADCIMLFSLGHRHLVPIDTHMAQVTLQVLDAHLAPKARARKGAEKATVPLLTNCSDTNNVLAHVYASSVAAAAKLGADATASLLRQRATATLPPKKAAREEAAPRFHVPTLTPRAHDAFQRLYTDAFGAEAGWAHTFLFASRAVMEKGQVRSE